MYHRISTDPETHLGPYFRLNTSPARFAEQMQALADGGWSVVGLNVALQALECASLADRLVVITFDDGYSDFLVHAAPVLARHRFTASVFLPTAYISDRPLLFRDVPCLTWPEVSQLRKAGFYFGSHTVSHPKLMELDLAQLRSELRDSKRAIEDSLGESVDTFAHPYAFPDHDREYVRRFSEEVEAAGYGCSVTTRLGTARRGDPVFTLKRLPVNDCDDPALFEAKLEGAYDWLAGGQTLFKRFKSVNRRRSFR